MNRTFLPVIRMVERAEIARDESDAAYYFELLYLGELVMKMLVIEVLGSIEDERDQNRHALEYKLVRANGIGEWAEALDEALTGPPSQHLIQGGRESQQAITSMHGPSSSTWQRRSVDLLTQTCRLLDDTLVDVSQQRVNLRQWIRQFVWLRNRTRGHGAARPEMLSRMCPGLQESINLVIDNAPAFGRSWSYLKRNMSGKYRVSPFGGDREPFGYLARQPDITLTAYIFPPRTAQSEAVVQRPRYLPTSTFLTAIFIMNFLKSFRISLTKDVTKMVVNTCSPVHGRPSSETAAAPELDVIGNAFTNMPPRRDGYVKRSALESQLTALLADDRHPLITLQGRGGVGKTSLTLAVLHQVAERESYYIIWFSARDIDLLPEGPRVVRPDVLSIEDLARDFNQLMRPGSVVKRREAEAFLTDSLAGQTEDGPFIFVFDNFETIRQQGELFAYLSNAVRLPNKVLITTRTRDFKADYPIEVHGMTRDEFTELVDDVSARLNISPLIDDEYEEQLFEESDGHPYITKILLGEVANAGHRVSLKRIVATKDALLDALFERSFSALSPAAQRVFLTLCSWRSLVPQIGIEAVLLRPGNERIDVERALSELEQSSLVEVVTAGDEGIEYLSVPLAAALFGRKKLITSPMKIAIDADLELIRGFGPTTTTDLGHGLASRIDRLARAVATDADDSTDLAQKLAVLEYIASEYSYAWLKLADLYEEIARDPHQAIHAVNKYLEERPESQNAWRRLISLYRGVDDVLGEMHARLQLAELTVPRFDDLSSAANRLNSILSAS